MNDLTISTKLNGGEEKKTELMIEERTGGKKVVLVLETKTVGALSSTF